MIREFQARLKLVRKGLYDVKGSTMVVQAESIAEKTLAASSLDEPLS